MKKILFGFVFLLISVSALNAQEKKQKLNEFKMFSRAEVSYLFGINDAGINEKINSLHIKLVIGTANPFVGFGVGLENASYKAADGNGANFQMLNLSANAHVLAKPISTDELNFFLKGAVGYAPRVFREYNKGFNYEIGPGILLTTKKKSKYFLQAMYQFQEIAGFTINNSHPKIKAVGLGIGTWF